MGDDSEAKASVAKARRLDKQLEDWKAELDRRERDYLRIKYEVEPLDKK